MGIHIRRGDYVHNKRLALCSGSYYEECIKKIKEKRKNPHFFIFSTDMEWAKENIKAEPAVYITHNGPDKAMKI